MSDKPTVYDHLKSLHHAIANLTSGDEYLRWLRFHTSFRQYSFHNTLLIAFQRPDASYVKGFQQWLKDHNRHVIKGEKGIAILAPVRIKLDKDDDESETALRFKVVYVFDISQTEGDDVPMPPAANQLEEGEVPPGALDTLIEQIEHAGFSYLIEINTDQLGKAHGKTDFNTSIVSIAPGLTNMQRFKTTAHELAHVILHGPQRMAALQLSKPQIEVEAEAVAAIVCAAWNIDSSDYSLSYIAQWAASDPGAVLRSAERSATAAKLILEGVEPDAATAAA